MSMPTRLPIHIYATTSKSGFTLSTSQSEDFHRWTAYYRKDKVEALVEALKYIQSCTMIEYAHREARKAIAAFNADGDTNEV